MSKLIANQFRKPGRQRVAGFEILGLATLAFLSSFAAAAQPGRSRQEQALNTPAESSIEAHFSAATQAQRLQNYPEAEKEYRAVLALKPDFAEVHMNLGLVYQLESRDEDAMTQFLRALKLKPRLSGANFFLGVDYCKLGNGAKAIPYFRTAVDQEPGRPDIRVWLATAFEMTGQIQAEVDTIGRALELEPASVDLLYLLGHAYERMGKNEVAAIEERAPGSAPAQQLLAESYAAGSNWATAVVHFENALAVSPRRPGLHVELGELLMRAGKLTRALGLFDDELKLDPHSVRALVRRGEAKLLQGDVDGLLADWSEAIRIDEPEAARVLGVREIAMGDALSERLPDELREKLAHYTPALQTRDSPAARLAVKFIAAQQITTEGTDGAGAPIAPAASIVTALEVKPDPPVCSQAQVLQSLEEGRISSTETCLVQLLPDQGTPEFRIRAAAALLEVGNSDASLRALAGMPAADLHTPEVAYLRARCYENLATEAYLKLYKADRGSYRVHQLLADLSAAKGNDVTAIEEYRASIALRPSLPNLHYSLGHLLWKNSQVPDARVELLAELALNQHHVGALYDLGQTYLLEQQPEKALSYLGRAASEGMENPELYRDLGTAYWQLGKYAMAVAEFGKAVTSDQDGAIHFKLAKAYKALGEKEKAAHEYALAAELNRESHRKVVAQAERIAQIER